MADTPTPPSIVERLEASKRGLCTESPANYMARLSVADALEAAATIRELAEALREAADLLDNEGYKPEAAAYRALLSRLNLEDTPHD